MYDYRYPKIFGFFLSFGQNGTISEFAVSALCATVKFLNNGESFCQTISDQDITAFLQSMCIKEILLSEMTWTKEGHKLFVKHLLFLCC